MAFSTRPPARAKMLSLRVTNEQDAELEKIAGELKLSGKSEVLRVALDYWLEHAPDAQRLRRK
mgnify:CR=1